MTKNKVDQISDLLLELIAERFEKETLEFPGIEFGDTFAELLDRFIVLHIRTWKLEDMIGDTEHVADIGILKKKLDHCFKVIRPKLTRAINCFIDAYVSKNHTRRFSEDNVKLYKGF